MAKKAVKAKTIDELTSVYEELNHRKIEANTQLKEASRQLKKLQEEAVREFGTSDIEELEKKLREMEAENERQRKEYQELLEGITSELKKIEDSSDGKEGEHAE